MLIGALVLGATLLIANWGRVAPFFLGLWTEIKQGFAGGIGGIAATILNFSPLGLFYRAFAGVLGWFGVELPGKFSEFGGNLVQGLINGFTSMFPNLTASIGGMAESVIGTFKNLLGIHSPSRVFAELGGHTMDGLAVGLEQGQGNPFAALTNIGQGLAEVGTNVLADVPLDNRAPLAARSPAGAAGGGNTYNVNITAAPGMDPAAIARMVRAELERLEREKGARARSSLFDQE